MSPAGGITAMMLPEMGTLSIQVKSSDSVVILELIGDLNYRADLLFSKFRDWPGGLIKEKRVLIVNFQSVHNASGAGIAILMRITRARAEGSFQTFAYGLSEYLERLFRIIGLTQYLVVYPDEYAIMQRLKEAKG
jgi:anti-anti-sigma factor